MTEAITPAFNLLDEPWLPVRTPDGAVREVGLSQALLHAGDYAALAETAPPNLIALYRLLLAVLHRALTTQHGAWKDADRARWFREGLPEPAIRAYLEQWRERFWLLHPSHPFMQVAALADAVETRDKRKPWTQILLEGASGNAPVVFDHSVDDQPRETALASVCRSLLGFLQFTPGGLVKTVRDSDRAGPLANTAAVLPVGDSLAETLLLALHPFDTRRGDDRPAWEKDAPSLEQLRAAPTLASGFNDRYTRQSRAVLLLAAGEGAVSHIRFAAGLALEDDPNAPDPMACYRINKDGKAIRITFNEGRALWRDLPSLLPDPTQKMDVPPRTLLWATELYQTMGRQGAQVQVLTAGLASDQAILADDDLAEDLREQVRFSEETFSHLRAICAGLIAQTMPDPQHKDTKSRARDILANGPAAPVFFSSAERALPKLMEQIAAGDIDAALADWHKALAQAAQNAWDAVRHSLGDSPAVLRADARAYPRFIGLIKTLTPPTDDTPAKEVKP